MKTLLCFGLVLGAAWTGWAVDALGASAKAPVAVGVPFDLQAFIDQQIAAGSRRIVVPPGRYRVTPRNQQHLLLRGLTDIQIIADDVEMICTETTRALTITSCTNLLVRGLTIEYDPLPFTQGRITGFATDKKVHEIELFEGYPAAGAARNFKYEVYSTVQQSPSSSRSSSAIPR